MRGSRLGPALLSIGRPQTPAEVGTDACPATRFGWNGDLADSTALRASRRSTMSRGPSKALNPSTVDR
jgi:hypothetical protein